MKFRSSFICSLLAIYLAGFSCNETDPIQEIVDQMTLEEKISMVHGESGKDAPGIPYVGYLPGLPRLSIPPLRMQNGPSGAGASFAVHRHNVPARS